MRYSNILNNPHQSRLVIISLYFVEEIFQFFISVGCEDSFCHGEIATGKNLVRCFLFLEYSIKSIGEFDRIIRREILHLHAGWNSNVHFISFLPRLMKIDPIHALTGRKPRFLVDLEKMLLQHQPLSSGSSKGTV